MKQLLQQLTVWVLHCSMILTLALVMIPSTEAIALGTDQLSQGNQIFEIHCAGCHIHGGNIIRRGKTLKLKALRKNNMASIPAIAEIVTNGKANMSAYRDRLTEQEIQTVAAYVLEQAEQGWKD